MSAGREAALAREGWTRRFDAAPPRLEETVELYRSIGLEVRLEPVAPRRVADVCRTCDVARRTKTIWTRPVESDAEGGSA